jgi:hypothetical protein
MISVLCYVDDILAIGHDAMAQLNKIDQYFKMKKGSISDPDIYLGSRQLVVRSATALSPISCIIMTMRMRRLYWTKSEAKR